MVTSLSQICITPAGLQSPTSPQALLESIGSSPSLSTSSQLLSPPAATPLSKFPQVSSIRDFLSYLTERGASLTQEDLLIFDFSGTLSEELKNSESVSLIQELLKDGFPIIVCTSEVDPAPFLMTLESSKISLTSRIGEVEIPGGILTALNKGLEIWKLLERLPSPKGRVVLIDDTITNLFAAQICLNRRIAERGYPVTFIPFLYESRRTISAVQIPVGKTEQDRKIEKTVSCFSIFFRCCKN